MDYLDMLAKLGIGNAHPGGFAATLKQLELYPLPANSRILEVGCGTGRTACYAASQGHEVTGVDIRPDMIAKAVIRAQKQQVNAQFMTGDACRLPFPDDSFDIILVESVTVFTDTAKALSEYYRVLRGGGKLYDREVVQRNPMPVEFSNELTQFYGIGRLWSMAEWLQLVTAAGFTRALIDGPFPYPEASEDLLLHPDPYQQIDAGSFLDPAIWEAANEYNRIMERYEAYIGYMVLTGTK